MKITQREAREAKARVRILEGRIRALTGHSGGYLHPLGQTQPVGSERLLGAIQAATKLGHAVVVHIGSDGSTVIFSALPEVQR